MQKITRPITTLLALTFTGLVLAGCSSVPLPKGTSKGYSSVRFITEKKSAEFYESDRSKEANQLLQKAIREQFNTHGINVVETNANLVVAYLIIITDNVSTKAISKHFGYRDDADDIQKKVHNTRNWGRRPEYVKRGTVVIDLIDSKTGRLVYRDYAGGSISSSLAPDILESRINQAVQDSMTAFFQ